MIGILKNNSVSGIAISVFFGKWEVEKIFAVPDFNYRYVFVEVFNRSNLYLGGFLEK